MTNPAIFLLLLLSLLTRGIAAQDADSTKTSRFSAFPIAYYTPETKLAFGGFGVYSFYNSTTDRQLPSQVQLGAAYTLNGQFLLYSPYRIYSASNKWLLYGELGYYRYSYFFYGIGNGARQQDEELYAVNFPRVRMNFFRSINEKLYAGLRFWFEDYDLKKLAAGGQLANGIIPGSEGSLVSGIGPAFNLDTRDDIFFPRSGAFVDAGMLRFGKFIGSGFSFSRYTIDGSKYIPIGSENVLAVNALADLESGSMIPFSQLALLGSNKKMRGYYEGRYRDKNLLALAAEYRFLLKGRFGATVFGNVGTVSSTIGELGKYLRPSAGAGLRYRFNKAQKLNIRLDVGLAPGSSAFYFTLGEAF